MIDEKKSDQNEDSQDATIFNADTTCYGKLCDISFSQGDKLPTAYETFSAPCIFSRTPFEETLLNLIKNPNITSSHLFRADIFYDSINDASYAPCNPTREIGPDGVSSFSNHMKPEYRPLPFSAEGFKLTRTLVRQLIPRNPNLDRPLVQTCHFLTSDTDEVESTMIVYLPHVDSEEAMPFYHPAVQMLAFVHSHHPGNRTSKPITTANELNTVESKISIVVSPFPATKPYQSKIERDSFTFSKRLTSTFTNLLRTIHKHATSHQLQSYTKRVHHDRIVPQKTFQDTYTQLKLRYAKSLIANWQESTDPGKHVFEDLGIAAFLIELWKNMYGKSEDLTEDRVESTNTGINEGNFPGFVDIGCGNGLLVNLLRKEGYEGWGFDVRQRKSWRAFDETVQYNLKEKVLVPYILEGSGGNGALLESDEAHSAIFIDSTTPSKSKSTTGEHFPGIFQAGSFIVSNHADELTAWTPILAYLSQCPFVCIPCCSHDLSGARTRFPPASEKKSLQEDPSATTKTREETDSQPKTGSLARPTPGKSAKVASAYSTLCDYVTRLSEELGFSVGKEMLRIPSTRNAAIVGRLSNSHNEEVANREEREGRVQLILERELGKPVTDILEAWLERASKIAASTGTGH